MRNYIESGGANAPKTNSHKEGGGGRNRKLLNPLHFPKFRVESNFLALVVPQRGGEKAKQPQRTKRRRGRADFLSCFVGGRGGREGRK